MQMVEASLAINPFDALVYLTLFIAGAISMYRGFVREFLSLFTWFGAAIITLAMSGSSIAFMSRFIESKMGAAAIGVLGTYFLVVVLLSLFTRGFLKYVRSGDDVGYLDNALGLLFGLMKGGLIIVLAFILLTFVFRADGYPEWLQNASTLPQVQKAAASVARLMPEHLGDLSWLTQDEEEYSDDPYDKKRDVESAIEEELFDLRLRREEENVKDDVGALEQLILDVTKDREDQGGF